MSSSMSSTTCMAWTLGRSRPDRNRAAPGSDSGRTPNSSLTSPGHAEAMKRVGALFVAVLAASAGAAPASRTRVAADCSKTSVGLVPLTDLKTGRYQGFQGGLYARGRNSPSRRYLKLGLTKARLVKPIGGRNGFLSIGMSNTTMEFSAFKQLADRDPRKNPRVTIVDGAQGGWDADRINRQGDAFWATVDQRLGTAGATGRQVE